LQDPSKFHALARLDNLKKKVARSKLLTISGKWFNKYKSDGQNWTMGHRTGAERQKLRNKENNINK
jgi:hypothetical protein